MKENEAPIRYQPIGEVELVRHPPQDSVCAGFRGMLRDYADQDLAPKERSAVDEHLHRCRDCSLALARAELEVLRIHSALTGRRPGEDSGPVGPPRTRRGFTKAVLARLQEQPATPQPKRLHRWWIPNQCL